MTAHPVRGHCAPEFDAVREAFCHNISTGAELGASIVVDVGGETVVDLWGGARDRAATQPWEHDTVVNLWSISKAVTNLTALMLVDRNLLDLDQPVAHYWPEFAANGKESVLVRHVLSHSSGVPGWEPPFTVQQMCDTDDAARRLADQPPWWEPGTASGYHAQNQGHLVGELVRRVTGKRLAEFIDQEIAEPLGADLHIGAARIEPDRIAQLDPPSRTRIVLPDGLDRNPMMKVFTAPAVNALAAETAQWRAAELGALNAHGNARSVARILSALSLGGSAGSIRLLSAAAAALPFVEQTCGIDKVLGIPLRWGIGYALSTPDAVPGIPEGRRCFWGGWGGSMVVMDPGLSLTVAYTMNRMSPGIIGSARSRQYLDAVFGAISQPPEK
ncbi:MAG TPA: serine hydrolase domain-containing protein [Micromonosporaceae bacterium]|nr:serine hydrolase domain-containing protein [Micromonosporaceae bacterium]